MKQVMNYNKDNGLLNMMKNRPHFLQKQFKYIIYVINI